MLPRHSALDDQKGLQLPVHKIDLYAIVGIAGGELPKLVLLVGPMQWFLQASDVWTAAHREEKER